jgi:hypothetical protein
MMPTSDSTTQELWKHVNFRIAWINEDFTENQFIVRAVFVLLTIIVFWVYAVRVLCRVHRAHKSQITLEQKSIIALTGLLFLFNNPWYLV